MRWAFLGIVRPMLCYGAMIWGHRAPELMEKFRRINRMAMNTFANFPKSTPTVALEVMLDVQPIHLFCIQEAIAARIRLDNVVNLDWHGTSHTKRHAVSHLKFLQLKMSDYGIDAKDSDSCHRMSWNTGFKINWDSFDGKSKHRQPTQVNVFTDGSKLDGRTGSGLVIYRGKREIDAEWYRLPDGCTVFQAEIAAIGQAVTRLLEIQDGLGNFVKIFVDSQAAIAALGNPHTKSIIVSDTIKQLNELAAKSRSVTLVWIPAHKGHEGNERADALAKMGSREEDESRLLKVNKPSATRKTQVRDRVYEEWQKEWADSKIANHTKSFYRGPDRSKARFVYKLARLELGRFVRIITGHNNLGFFQNKIGLSNQRGCRLCGEGDETIMHLLHDCPRLTSARTDIFLDKIPTSDMTWSVRRLLEFSYCRGVNEAYEGNWTNSDPPVTDHDMSFGLDWLDDEEDDATIDSTQPGTQDGP